jgi:hypothetical protein
MNWVFISQKTTFFIVTAVKTSNVTSLYINQCWYSSPINGRSNLSEKCVHCLQIAASAICVACVLSVSVAANVIIPICNIPCRTEFCGVTDPSACSAGEQYVPSRKWCVCCFANCCAACVTTVGTCRHQTASRYAYPPG